MSRRLWYLLALLGILTLAVGADAQVTPTWKNDAQGRPAPPCMLLDATTGLSTPCSATNPIPTAGGAGQGTTSGTSTTGFGKAWYPSTITGTIAAGEGMIPVFNDSNSQVIFFRRSTTCASCLQVAISNDGGITGTFFNTTGTLGNSIQAAHKVPSSTPRYLVSSIGGPLNILQSTSLLSGWTAVTGLTSAINSWASNADGSVVLSSDGAGAVCRSTDNGVSFGSCVAAGGSGQLTHAGGTTWLLAINAVGSIRRSIDNGATWASVANGSGANTVTAVCLAPTSTVCLTGSTNGVISRSTDSGATWATADTGLGAVSIPALCDYGSNVAVGINVRSAPIGFAAITTDTHSTFNAGVTWFNGTRFGSAWDGAGVPGGSIACNASGRGVVAINTGTQVFAEYNPLIAPGGTLESSAGGYNVSAPIQAGVILNTTPTTSAANTAAVVTLTNTAGSRICIRRIEVFNTGAAGNFTVTVSDGATVVLNLGTLIFAAPPQSSQLRDGAPLLCSQTSNNLTVNIGAGGAGAISTTSVVADRYPN